MGVRGDRELGELGRQPLTHRFANESNQVDGAKSLLKLKVKLKH
jgi:hypothetical protein